MTGLAAGRGAGVPGTGVDIIVMRIMGLDIGEKWIGMAMSDPTETLATPLSRIASGDTAGAIEAIVSLAQEHGVGRIVAGMPYTLSGAVGPQAQSVEAFLQALADSTTIPVEGWDERFSTSTALERMREAGVSREHMKERVDAAAAAVILQDYLDSARSA